MSIDLSNDDVSGVIRLVREVTDMWDDPAAWRKHLLHGACALLNGNVGTMVVEHGGTPPAFGRLAVAAVVGVPEELRAHIQPALSQFNSRTYDDASNQLLPGISSLFTDMVRQGWVTTSRSGMCGDGDGSGNGDGSDSAAFHPSAHYREVRRKLNADDFVVSIRFVDVPRRPEAIAVDRPPGAPRFGPREVALLRLLHDEIAPLIGVRLATEEYLCRGGLSKRLNETLSLLLDGRSEKEAAAAMGVGARTVHEYVTMLYEHFRVSSRAELLAYFIRRTPVPREPRAT